MQVFFLCHTIEFRMDVECCVRARKCSCLKIQFKKMSVRACVKWKSCCIYCNHFSFIFSLVAVIVYFCRMESNGILFTVQHAIFPFLDNSYGKILGQLEPGGSEKCSVKQHIKLWENVIHRNAICFLCENKHLNGSQ